jgi:PIN domain nuclease of toxin-antitoxin system
MQASPEKFGSQAAAIIRDERSELLLSAASSWEIAIKYALGKLPLPAPPADYIPDRIRSSGVQPVAVEHTHAVHVATLPTHHRDPFDRLLIAQAQVLGVALLTADRRFEPYGVEILWAT